MEQKSKIGRRSFFSGLALLAVAGTALKLSRSAPDAGEFAAASPEGDGYRLTEHIKKYYRTTTI
jgi:hypothetical protein